MIQGFKSDVVQLAWSEELVKLWFTCYYHIVQDLRADKSQPSISSIARQHLHTYNFPVMIILSLYNGTIIHFTNANDLLDMGAEQESFLENG